MSPLTVGACFAGIGGIELGLESTGGFNTVWHSEVDPHARRVFAARFPNSQPQGDVRALADGLMPPPDVDVLTGGPPCQGLSKANAHGRRGLEDERSGLFHAYARLIAALEPTWVVMEQVTGLLTSGDDYDTVVSTYREMGYDPAIVAVDSLTYVPQARARLVFVCHRDHRAARRALLPLLEDGATHPRESGTRRPRHDADRATGGPHVYRKGRRARSDTDHETWVRADYANTLTVSDVGPARATVIVLDEQGRPRVLTPQEWEVCHGFPRGWTTPAGSDAHRWALLGNAVSPPVMQRVGVGILAAEEEADA
jgi:site-specific DNA-cytosine methylase